MLGVPILAVGFEVPPRFDMMAPADRRDFYRRQRQDLANGIGELEARLAASRAELAKLDQEVARLDKLLAPPSPSSGPSPEFRARIRRKLADRIEHEPGAFEAFEAQRVEAETAVERKVAGQPSTGAFVAGADLLAQQRAGR